MAERAGQSTIALLAYHDAVRLGDVRAVEPVSRLAVEVDCKVGHIVVKHALALRARNAAALTAAAKELSGIGMAAAAADARAQAQLHRS